MQLDINLERIFTIGELVHAQLDDAAAGPYPRLAVGPAHVLEYPAIGMDFQSAREVADWKRQPGPRDFAALGQVDFGVDRDSAFRPI